MTLFIVASCDQPSQYGTCARSEATGTLDPDVARTYLLTRGWSVSGVLLCPVHRGRPHDDVGRPVRRIA